MEAANEIKSSYECACIIKELLEEYVTDEKQGDKPIVWVNAAMWFHEQGNNAEKVKNIFFRGLQRHPECELLYTCFFKVLLAETANQPKEFQNASLERVLAIYNTAKKKICNVSFLITLINQCDEERYSDFTKPLQKLIIDDMMDLYPREEKVWDLLAQRELKGVSMAEFFKSFSEPDTTIDKENFEGHTERIVKPPTLRRRIEMCFSVYQTATQTLKTKEMWSLFLTAMIDLNTDKSTQQALKRKKLALAFRSAHENNCMTADHYYAYINLLVETKANRDFIVNVLLEATERFNSVKLWEQRLTFHIIEDNQFKVYETFRKATNKLGGESYPLWKLALQYYQTRYDDQYDRLREIYKEACEHTEPAFGTFRAQYLEWSVVNETFKATRKLYAELMKLSPPSLELHQKMGMLEAQSLNPDMNKQRDCFENAITDFGKTRTDVWIDLIKFERDEGEPKRVSNLCERAKQTLDPTYVDNFLTEFCLLTVNTNPNNNNSNNNK